MGSFTDVLACLSGRWTACTCLKLSILLNDHEVQINTRQVAFQEDTMRQARGTHPGPFTSQHMRVHTWCLLLLIIRSDCSHKAAVLHYEMISKLRKIRHLDGEASPRESQRRSRRCVAIQPYHQMASHTRRVLAGFMS